MAKLNVLDIEVTKINGNAVSAYFYPDFGSGNTLIYVENPFTAPVMIWYGADGAGSAAMLMRESNSAQLGICGEYGRKIGIDAFSPEIAEYYSVSGTGAVIFGALVVYR